MCRIVAKPQTILETTCFTDPSLLSDSALKRCLNKKMSSSKVKAEMDELIKSKPVLVISKSYCPFCKKAKQVSHTKNRIRTKFVSRELLKMHQVIVVHVMFFSIFFNLGTFFHCFWGKWFMVNVIEMKESTDKKHTILWGIQICTTKITIIWSAK